MASHYGFKAMVPGVLVELPGSADLSRTKQSEQSYRKCRAGGWGCSTNNGTNGRPSPVGKCGSIEVNGKTLAFPMR